MPLEFKREMFDLYVILVRTFRVELGQEILVYKIFREGTVVEIQFSFVLYWKLNLVVRIRVKTLEEN